MAKLPLFPVTSVGSWPRPDGLLKAMKRRSDDLAELANAATVEAIRCQEEAGVDIICDGEQRRDNFYSFITDHVDGLELMTMADLLEYVEDKAGFEELLNALDVPAFAIRNPTVIGRLAAREPLALGDFRFLKERTDRATKVTLPGPYLLSRSSWVKALSEETYPTRESLAEDIVGLLGNEARALAGAGADFIQFDEPVLTELAFAGKSTTRTFMCAALAANASPEEELEFAIDVINRVVDGIDGPIVGVHICRGNWSQNEDVLLEGSYDPLIPHLEKLRVDQLVLEYATPRAGSIRALGQLPERVTVGFGAVNPRTTEIEDPEAVASRVREAVDVLSPERIFLNPDCGFGTFAERPVATATVATEKLRTLVRAAEILRAG